MWVRLKFIVYEEVRVVLTYYDIISFIIQPINIERVNEIKPQTDATIPATAQKPIWSEVARPIESELNRADTKL